MNKSLKSILYYLFLLGITGLIFMVVFLISLRLIFLKKEIDLPDFTGKQFYIAQKEAQESGCSLYISDLAHSRDYDEGIIMSQRLKPGTAVARNRNIPVTVSLGPERTIMADYTGQLYYEALRNLRMKGFYEVKTVEVYSAYFLQNHVIAQHPSPNVNIYQNRPVTLIVSSGRKRRRFILPDLIGKDFFEVQYILDSMNLFIDEIHFRDIKGFPEDIVVNQKPLSGTMINEGDYVSITLNKKGIKDFVRQKYIFEILPLPPGIINHKISIYKDRGNTSDLIRDITANPGSSYPVFITGYKGDKYLLYINNIFYKEYTIK